MSNQERSWHHRPNHIFMPGTAYMVTAGTLHKEHLFTGQTGLDLLETTLLNVAEAFAWTLNAWAVFSNHYHFVADSPRNADSLKMMIQQLHSETARILNERDGRQGRRVWFQYWDVCLDFAASYYCRLNYVMNNPVKHGFVARAEDYPHCSARWFMLTAEKTYYRRVTSHRFDTVRVVDDF